MRNRHWATAMRYALAAVVAVLVAGCATWNPADGPRIEVARGGQTAPTGIFHAWRTVDPQAGVDLGEASDDDRFWLRVTSSAGGEQRTTVLGPIAAGQGVNVGPALGAEQPQLFAITPEASLADIVSDPGAKDDKHYGIEVKVKPKLHIGPLKTNFPTPVVIVSGGGGGGGSSNTTEVPGPQPTALKAGIEGDPQHQPGDEFCQAPMRLYNREAFQVIVKYNLRYVQSGPGCNTVPASYPYAIPMEPMSSQRAFCSLETHPGSFCSDSKKAENVRAER